MLGVQRTECSAGRGSRWPRWGFLSLMAAFSAALWIHRQDIQGWTTYGYLGVLAFSLLANAMILLPAPVLAVVFALGSVLSPLGISMAAGLGMALNRQPHVLVTSLFFLANRGKKNLNSLTHVPFQAGQIGSLGVTAGQFGYRTDQPAAFQVTLDQYRELLVHRNLPNRDNPEPDDSHKAITAPRCRPVPSCLGGFV